MTYMAKRLLQHLSDRPQRAKALLYMIGLDPIHDGAKLRDLVHELRLNGYPVCARTNKGGGYWLSNKDIKLTIADLKSRRNELNDIIRALECGPIDGQIDMSMLKGEE